MAVHGGYLDSQTGLVKEGQRFYDPTLGRWTQQDPLPLGNRYLYADDDPIDLIDPSGLQEYANATATPPSSPAEIFNGTGPLGFTNNQTEINRGIVGLGLAAVIAPFSPGLALGVAGAGLYELANGAIGF